MIFVTTGTHETPFDRLVVGAAPLAELDELVVQHGSSAVRIPAARQIEFAPFDELSELASRARVVVTHAGAGSILVSLAAGKRPIVVPRLAALGEAVDDHQLDFGRHLHARGVVTLVEDVSGLREAAAHAGRSDSSLAGPAALVNDLGAYVHAAITGR